MYGGIWEPTIRLCSKLLGNESPEQLAHRLVTGTHLDDAKVREELYKGGAERDCGLDGPDDPICASINDDLLAVRKDYEARVDAPTRAAAEKIAKARFAVYGTSVDPDATFTLRLSYGTVKGFEDAEGKFVQPYTTIGGLFQRATGAPPYKLPETWLNAKASLNLSLPMNLSTTNDIIGGNSGSPLIDKDAQGRRAASLTETFFRWAATTATTRSRTAPSPWIAVRSSRDEKGLPHGPRGG